jgi:hypothetical protein
MPIRGAKLDQALDIRSVKLDSRRSQIPMVMEFDPADGARRFVAQAVACD